MLPPKAGPKVEPISPLLTTTLVHTDRKANIGQLKYSDDGKKLFLSGYPSGLVQIFDVESKKELLRIETPKGYRGTDAYALLTPDWKTLYTWDERARKVVPTETDGKKDYRIEYSGHVLAWDATTGKAKDGFAPEKDCGVSSGKLSPDGTKLLVVETQSCLASKRDEEKRTMFIWDLKTVKKTKLGDGYLVPTFHPDGKTVFLNNNNYEAKTSDVRRLDMATGQELAKFKTPEKGLMLSVADVSPDGKLVAVRLGGVLGATPTTLILDASTLKEVGKIVGKPDPDSHGWGGGRFTLDSQRFIATSNDKGTILLWSLAEKKVVRTIESEGSAWGWKQTVSPDGKWLAVPSMPASLEELRSAGREPDPMDLPQPRVTLYHLTDEKVKPVVMIAPHGFVGDVAFRPDGKQLAFGSVGSVHLFDLSKIGK